MGESGAVLYTGAVLQTPLMAKTMMKTPIGMLQWAQILEPAKALDADKPDLWKVDLVASWDQASYELTQALETVYMEAFGRNASPAEHAWPFKMEALDGKDTGNIIFTFKRSTINSNGRPVSRPIVVDSQRNAWPKELLIGNGSYGIVAFSPFTWRNKLGKCGVSLYLDGVQVLSHVPYESFDAESTFDVVEGGFVAPQGDMFGQAAPEPQAAAAAPLAPPAPARPAPARPAPARPTPAPTRPPAPSGQAQPWSVVAGPASDEEVPY